MKSMRTYRWPLCLISCEVIGEGAAKDLEGDDIKRLMAGGAEIGDLAKELAI